MTLPRHLKAKRQRIDAQFLAPFFNVSQEYVQEWMQARKFAGVTEMRDRWPGSLQEFIRQAQRDYWAWCAEDESVAA